MRVQDRRWAGVISGCCSGTRRMLPDAIRRAPPGSWADITSPTRRSSFGSMAGPVMSDAQRAVRSGCATIAIAGLRLGASSWVSSFDGSPNSTYFCFDRSPVTGRISCPECYRYQLLRQFSPVQSLEISGGPGLCWSSCILGPSCRYIHRLDHPPEGSYATPQSR
jgi:hypothetical protein